MDFPFDIYMTADKLGMTPRRIHAKSSDYDCVFCGGKGKLNLNVERNTFRCNKCGSYGGMISLFCRVTGIGDAKEAYRILAEHSNNKFQQSVRINRRREIQSIQEAVKADIDTIHKCYSTILGLLKLRPQHRQNLIDRGLTDAEIDTIGYKSVPMEKCYQLISVLSECGVRTIGVPGFYTGDDGNIALNVYGCMAGYFVPVYNSKRQIQAMQIRLDTPLDGKRKYMWLSSAEKNGGCSSNSPVAVSGDVFNGTAVYITEGPLKGQVAHALSGKPFLSIAGVSQMRELEKFFGQLRSVGKCEFIVDAMDMDDDTNEHVRKAHMELAWLAEKYGFIPRRLMWDRKYKGIDDFLLARKKRKENKI